MSMAWKPSRKYGHEGVFTPFLCLFPLIFCDDNIHCLFTLALLASLLEMGVFDYLFKFFSVYDPQDHYESV